MRRLLLLVLLVGIGLCLAQEEVEIPELAVEVQVEAEKEKPAQVVEVPVEKIEKMVNVQSIPDVLKRQAGTESAVGAALCATMPIVRGNDSKWTQVLLEGAILSPIGRPFVLNMMPLTAIEKVELVKGPAPPQYPGSTIGGLVLLTMKSGDKYPGGDARLTFGSYGRQTYEVWSGGGDEEQNYFVAVNRNLHTGWLPHQRQNLTEVSLKLQFSPDPTSKVSLLGTSLNGIIWGYRPLGPNPFGSWEAEWTIHSRATSAITYTKRLTDKTDYMLRITPYSFSGDQVWQKYSKATGQVQPVFMPWRYALLKTEFQYNIRPNPNSIWTWGMGYQRDRFRTPGELDVKYMGNIPDDKWKKYIQTFRWAFLQNTFINSKRQLFTLALRFDDASPGKTIISPFLSSRLPIDQSTNLRIAVTKNRRFADLNELYGEGMWVGNINLKPETGWTYQVDWEKKMGDKGTLTLSLYHTKLDNVIGADQNNVFQNIGRARLRGLECEYERATPWGSWWYAYTFLDAKDLVQNRPLIVVFRTAMPKHSLKTGVTINDKNGLNYDLELLMYGPRRTDVDKPTFVGDPWNVTVPPQIGGYAVVNLKIEKQFSQDRSFTLAVENLFDKEYQDLLFYPRAGRWVSVTFSQKF